MTSGTRIADGRLEDIGSVLAGIPEILPGNTSSKPKIAVICDENVAGLYLDRVMDSLLGSGFGAFPLIVGAGEASKNGEAYLKLLEGMAEIPLTRTDIALCLGGGVPGDLGGFAAATYMRGVPVCQVPTTLLAMVDSAIGGKTGIDLPQGKNLAGAFHEPFLVYTDISVLSTLPRREFISGMAEVVKYGVIAGDHLMSLIEDAQEAGPSISEEIVDICRRTKLGIVSGDLTDTGKRQILNLGHTIGHAVEKLSGYEISHGEAVSIGMAEILRIFSEKGETSSECAERTLGLLRKIGLPTECPFTGEALFDIIKNDKKRKGGEIDLVVPENIGRCVLRRLSMAELETLLK